MYIITQFLPQSHVHAHNIEYLIDIPKIFFLMILLYRLSSVVSIAMQTVANSLCTTVLFWTSKQKLESCSIWTCLHTLFPRLCKEPWELRLIKQHTCAHFCMVPLALHAFEWTTTVYVIVANVFPVNIMWYGLVSLAARAQHLVHELDAYETKRLNYVHLNYGMFWLNAQWVLTKEEAQ